MTSSATQFAVLVTGLVLVVVVVLAPGQAPYEARVFRTISEFNGQLVDTAERPSLELCRPSIALIQKTLSDCRAAGQSTCSPPSLEICRAAGDENIITLDDLEGRIVFLNLWASWCKPCVEEMPSMIQLALDMAREQGVDLEAQLPETNPRFVILAVSWDEDLVALERFIDSVKHNNTNMRESMILAYDPQGALTRRLGTRKLPETYLIDGDGRLVARFQNQRDWAGVQARELMHALIHRQGNRRDAWW